MRRSPSRARYTCPVPYCSPSFAMRTRNTLVAGRVHFADRDGGAVVAPGDQPVAVGLHRHAAAGDGKAVLFREPVFASRSRNFLVVSRRVAVPANLP